MRMMPCLWLAAISFALLIVSGCKPRSTTPEKESPSKIKIQPHLSGDEVPSVVFDMKPSTDSPDPTGFRVYECSYSAEGKTAKFRIQFKQSRSMSGDIPMAPGEGKFLAVAGSDNTILIRELKKALDAKQLPPRSSQRISQLPFDAVVLGLNQSRDSSGGFSDNPPGYWMAIKLFFPRGGDDGEVFLNLNPKEGKGEFSIKDSDYGDYLLREFAKVL